MAVGNQVADCPCRPRGGLANAARAATTALQDLGLATPDARVLDAFDPFAFGSDGDDIGMALTLTAMLKVVHQLRETSEPPLWWTNTVRRRAEELANAGSENRSQAMRSSTIASG